MTNSVARAPRCPCGGEGELRRCAGNGGIGWRCPSCSRVLSEWISHDMLRAAGVDIAGLPAWDNPLRDERQTELPL